MVKKAPSNPGEAVIVLVEDDPVMRRTILDILEMFGYTVLPADDGQHALALCKSLQGTPDLLLSDCRMPEMGGKELVEELEKLQVLPNVLMMTGYPEEEIGRLGNDPKYPVITKPFTPSDLAKRVGEVLGQPATRVRRSRRSTAKSGSTPSPAGPS
jgi:two-component system, cell cycle sensor histidine kinase and response regulator CckA